MWIHNFVWIVNVNKVGLVTVNSNFICNSK